MTMLGCRLHPPQGLEMGLWGLPPQGLHAKIYNSARGGGVITNIVTNIAKNKHSVIEILKMC